MSSCCRCCAATLRPPWAVALFQSWERTNYNARLLLAWRAAWKSEQVNGALTEALIPSLREGGASTTRSFGRVQESHREEEERKRWQEELFLPFPPPPSSCLISAGWSTGSAVASWWQPQVSARLGTNTDLWRVSLPTWDTCWSSSLQTFHPSPPPLLRGGDWYWGMMGKEGWGGNRGNRWQVDPRLISHSAHGDDDWCWLWTAVQWCHNYKRWKKTLKVRGTVGTCRWCLDSGGSSWAERHCGLQTDQRGEPTLHSEHQNTSCYFLFLNIFLMFFFFLRGFLNLPQTSAPIMSTNILEIKETNWPTSENRK